MTAEAILLLLVISVVIGVFAYSSGKKAASGEEEVSGRKLLHRHTILESQVNGLQNEIEVLTAKSARYLHFLIRIPEAVKNINTRLSLDELPSSIIRLTKDLIDTDKIEIYLFDNKENCLKLAAAYGTNRGKSIKIKPKEGVIGGAAHLKMTFSLEQLRITGKVSDEEKVDTATPILFQGELMGVIGIGKIRTKTEDEKRFLAMIADLSAIALKNCEYLSIAKEGAIKDEPTGLYNRRYFMERALESTQKSKSYDFNLSVFMFDIDDFKKYNDVNGHVLGDELLRELCMLVKESTRSTDVIAKYGGEEFVVLLENTDKDQAMLYAEKIRKLIEKHPFPSREKQPLGFISVSGGVAAFNLHGDTIGEVVGNAGKALCRSKELGKNRITLYMS